MLGLAIFAIVLVFAGAIALDFYGAFIIACAWQWFITPATGFPPIGYWNAFGLLLLFSFLVAMVTSNGKESKTEVESASELVVAIAGQWIGILIGMTLSFGIMALVHLGVQ